MTNEKAKDGDDWDAIAYIGGAALLIFLAIGGYIEWQHVPVGGLPLAVQLIGKAAVLVFFGCIVVQGVRQLVFKKAKPAQSAPRPQDQPAPPRSSPGKLRDDNFVP